VGKGRHIADGRWRERAVGSDGGCAAGIWVITLVFGCTVLGVEVVHCWAGDVTWETTEGVLTRFTTGFQLLATQAAGQQIR
jgi:hypothetical protein